MNLSCFLVDDDTFAIDILEKHIKQTPYTTLAGADTSPVRAIHKIKSSDAAVKVVFLDIDMKEMDGLEVAAMLEDAAYIIFTTGIPEYAARAFDMAVVDYLVKPVTYPRFLQALDRLKEKIQARQNNLPGDDFCYIYDTEQKKTVRLRYKDVDYFEAFSNYISVVSGTDRYSIYVPLNDLEAQLPGLFTRIHRSFIINRNKVRTIEGNLITLENGTKITVGKSYRQDFFDEVNQKIIRRT